jgi:hypothetical protein
MELKQTGLNIDSVADLVDIRPQKLHHTLSKLGTKIPEDCHVDETDIEIALLELGIDWNEFRPRFEVGPAYQDGKGDFLAVYDNLAQKELAEFPHTLVFPDEPEDVLKLVEFFNQNHKYDSAAKLLRAACCSPAVMATVNSSEWQLNYALARAKHLLSDRAYDQAGELAFASLAIEQRVCDDSKRVQAMSIYLGATLVAEGIVQYSALDHYTLQELILTGLQSGQVKALSRLQKAFLRTLFLSDSFIAGLNLTKQTRTELRKCMDELAPDYRGQSFYPHLARLVTKPVTALYDAARASLAAEGFAGIEQHRERLIRSLKGVEPYGILIEGQVINDMLDLLGGTFTNFNKQRQNASVRTYAEAHTKIISNCSNLEKQIDNQPTWLASCVILPVLCWFRSCLNADFKENTSDYTTTVNIYLDKKEYPLKEGAIQEVSIYCNNEGKSLAESIAVEFTDSSTVKITPVKIEFGNIDTGLSSGLRTFVVKILRESAAYELPYLLHWSNSNGERVTLAATVKLLPQKQIDWQKYEYMNPYSISSVKEFQPDRLKGRADKLAALRMGLHHMQSFFITGQKRVGKSSIANVYYGELLAHEKILPVHFLWGDVADCDLPSLGTAICRCVHDAWETKTHTQLPCEVPTPQDFQSGFSQTLSRFLMKFNRQVPEWKLVFIIDDFDEIREDLYKGENGDVFFTTLRAFIDRAFSSFIIVGSEKLFTSILREQGQKVNQADNIQVDYLSNRDDLEELITEPAKEVLFFEQDAISEIIELTSGNPYYTNLLCSRIFRLMIGNQDYYVARSNVRRAAELLANEDTEKSYKHFWVDGIRDVGPEKERIEYNNAMTLIAISKSEHDVSGAVDIHTIYKQPEVLHMETAELEYRLNELADRNVLRRSPNSPNHYLIKVELFNRWLQAGGAHQIRQSFGEFEYKVRPLKDYAIFPEEIAQVSQELVYRGETVDRILVETWLRQFGNEYNQRLAFKVLAALKERGYYSTNKFNHALEMILNQAAASVNGWARFIGNKRNLLRNVLICHIDPPGKSGTAIVTEFRRVNQVFYKLCGSIDNIAEILAGNSEVSNTIQDHKRWLLIMVDDFVGTGRSGSEYAVNALEILDQRVPGWESMCYRPAYGFVSGFDEGAQAIESAAAGRVTVFIVNPLEEKDRAFSKTASIFSDDRERSNAKSLFMKIGESLEKKHPLGFNDSQALVVFPNNTPNNTLPIFYKKGRYEGKVWTPLFERL